MAMGIRFPRSITRRKTDPRSGLQASRCILCGLWLFLFGPVAAQGADGWQTYFRAPVTGQRVTQYEIELPMNKQEQRSFLIPGDCPELAQAAAEGASQWGTQLEKSLWWKAESDCRYSLFLKRYPSAPVQDYVSGYDFQNAPLSELPLQRQCSRPETAPLPCAGFSRATGLHHLLSTDDSLQDTTANGDGCRVRNGTFRGWVRFTEGEIHCKEDPSGPGFRIIAIDYSDVNGDGYLDAVLRLFPLGPRRGRTASILPITRLAPDAPLGVPNGMPML